MNENMLIITVAAIVLLGSYVIYASLIRKKNKAGEAFPSIDVQMKKRYDLIPDILTIAGKYTEHERGLPEDITRLRTEAMKLASGNAGTGKKIQLDDQIQGLMGELAVAVENYPQIKADQTMIQAMRICSEAEEHISAARRFYNSAVLELNNAVEIFPNSLIAGITGVRRQEFSEAAEAERQSVGAGKFLS